MIQDLLSIIDKIITSFTGGVSIFTSLIKFLPLMILSFNSYTPSNTNITSWHAYLFILNIIVFLLSLYFIGTVIGRIICVLSLLIYYTGCARLFGSIPIVYFLIFYFIIYK